MTKQTEYWYRFDSWTQEYGFTLYLSKYKVTKHTEKGVWIEYGFKKDKFILTEARKHFACSTVSEAKLSFIARKKRQLGLLEAQAGDVRAILSDASALMDTMAQRQGEQHGEENKLQPGLSES